MEPLRRERERHSTRCVRRLHGVTSPQATRSWQADSGDTLADNAGVKKGRVTLRSPACGKGQRCRRLFAGYESHTAGHHGDPTTSKILALSRGSASRATFPNMPLNSTFGRRLKNRDALLSARVCAATSLTRRQSMIGRIGNQLSRAMSSEHVVGAPSPRRGRSMRSRFAKVAMAEVAEKRRWEAGANKTAYRRLGPVSSVMEPGVYPASGAVRLPSGERAFLCRWTHQRGASPQTAHELQS